ncbi:hypothetical protein ZWY2020_022842 [Hordeum vulgare]|nr:hypothetical protein ZWY2020_022842 [Hordeum vulgare]
MMMKRSLELEPRPVYLSPEKCRRLALESLSHAAPPLPMSKPACESSSHRDREEKRGLFRHRDREEKDVLEKTAEKLREKIREQYLGSNSTKTRTPTKPSAKFPFSFDWEKNTDDTSSDTNALHQSPLLLYGRGFLAGIDRRQQKEEAAQKENRVELRRDTSPEERTKKKAEMRDSFGMRVDRHWSDKAAEEMTERDWRIFREDFNISYKGSRLPRPMRHWKESKLGTRLLRAIDKVGYKKPSPIQMATIPLGLQQRDVIGVAETGSGKTAAFVLPMLSCISRLPPIKDAEAAEGPYALVMAPTRELAQQIERETSKLSTYLGIKVVSIVGGQSIEEQGFKVRQGCEVVIATPGRLLDCLEKRYIVLNQCNYVVLDEADRMIDMGFEPQVAGVLDAMPSSNLKPQNAEEELDEKKTYRTTYMFSATMPPAESDKMPRLRKIMADLGEDKTAVVFCNTKRSVDDRARDLERLGFHVTTLHGGKSQDQRETSLDGFRNRGFNVLVATDVAGRGIDIPDVAHVINYEMPNSVDTYTHRIGRTGRAGKKGLATSFLTLEDRSIFFDLKQMLVQNNSSVPPELARHEASKFKPGTIFDRPPKRCDTKYASH